MVNGLEITELHFMPIQANENLIGFISLVINNSFFIGGIAVYTLKDRTGYRILYPTKDTKVMKYRLHHPINKEVSLYFQETITKEVEKQINLLKGIYEN